MKKFNKTGQKEVQKVPNSLKVWFVIHFVVDIVVAIPLFLLPETILGLFGWDGVDPVTTRLFAAALFGIGIESYLVRDSGAEVYSGMLNLKIIWSTFAALAFLLSIIGGEVSTNILIWLGLIVFVLFNFVWVYWKIRLNFIQKRRI